MTLQSTGPAATGRARRPSSVRVLRSTYGPSLRRRRIRVAATDSWASEALEGSALISGFFAGLSRLGTTGTVQLRSKLDNPTPPESKDVRDDGVVFVAGSTGRTGARVVRELLNSGFTVRAGARNEESAQSALAVATAYGILKPEQLKRVTVVPFDLGNPAGFEEAIGIANKIVCAVGAAEDQDLDFSAPKKIDGEGTIALVNKAAELDVGQFVLVSSLGTGKLGWPAGVLNIFGGVLLWKREAEKALESSGMAYTIVRPGGMERPNDEYKRTHSLVLKPRDTTFGGQVSRLQVAELVAAACRTPAAENKVLEVVAETTALPRGFQELMTEIGQDISREAQLANKEAVDAAHAHLAAAQLKASQADAVLLAAEKRVEELAARLKEAKATEAAVKKDVAPLLKQVKPLETQLADARSNAEHAALLETASKMVLERTRRAAGAGVLLSEKERAAIVEEVLNPPRPVVAEAAAPQQGSGKIFGFFGKKPEAPAGPSAQDRTAAEVATKTASGPLGGLIVDKSQPAAEEPAAEAVVAAAVNAPAEVRPVSAGLFAGLFGKPPAVEHAREPGQVATAAVVAVKEEPAATSPVPGRARAMPPLPAPKAELEMVVVGSTASDVVMEEPKPLFNVGSFFGGLMRRVDEQQAALSEAAAATVAGPQPVLALAAAAAPVAAEATVSTFAPKPAPSKPAVPATAGDSVEEERRHKVMETAKAALAASVAAQCAAAPAPSPVTPAAVPEAAKPEPAKTKAPVPAQEKPEEAAPAQSAGQLKGEEGPEAADIARRKAKVKAWIASWKDGRNASAVSQNDTSAAAPVGVGVAEVDPAESESASTPMSNFITGLST